MPNSGVFLDGDEAALGIKLRPPNLFDPDPGVRLKRGSLEAASAHGSLSSLQASVRDCA